MEHTKTSTNWEPLIVSVPNNVSGGGDVGGGWCQLEMVSVEDGVSGRYCQLKIVSVEDHASGGSC